MQKNMKYIMLILVVMISGCAAPIMTKPGATDQMAMKDNMECELMGMQYATGAGFNGNMLIISDYRAQCLRMRGWR